MIYDLIIIGAGAAGLFAGAALSSPVNGLIIEKKAAPGRKLLMSGSGQCNLTHGGNMKDFISHYGKNGTLIRSILYQFNNQSVINFFEQNNIPLFEREDRKIFPKSLQAQDVLDLLVKRCTQNGLKFCYSTAVNHIICEEINSEINLTNYEDHSKIYSIQSGNHQYQAKKIIISTGGCSYPVTGSDGSLFSVLKEIGITVSPLSPSLVPILVHEYPYKSLSGISFQNAGVAIISDFNSIPGQGKKIAENQDAVLLTHTGFSGPAILNLSRYAHSGDTVSIDYYPAKTEEFVNKELSKLITGNSKQLLTVLSEYFNEDRLDSPSELPKRFLETLCFRTKIDPSIKSSRISGFQLKSIVRLIKHDQYKIQKLGGYESAMVTAGGVSLTEINTKTMESRKFPGVYFAGEVLDIDGDTGGYNLQFAFSSGHLAAKQII